MVDVGSAVLAAGLGLAQRLIFRWITEGRSRVRARERRLALEEIAASRAIELSMRVDELERAAEAMMREIARDSPSLSYSRIPFARTLRIESVSGHRSAGELIEELEIRISAIAERDGIVLPPVARIAEVNVEIVKRAPSFRQDQLAPPTSRSAEMIEDMRRRIAQRESGRR